jgi:hypothetical protein
VIDGRVLQGFTISFGSLIGVGRLGKRLWFPSLGARFDCLVGPWFPKVKSQQHIALKVLGAERLSIKGDARMRLFHCSVRRLALACRSISLVLAAWPPSNSAQITLPPLDIDPLFASCGGLGDVCCRPPALAAAESTPVFGPLVSCGRGLGCDITSDRCVQPCGGTGQVCCDGPETRALK